MFGKKYNPFEVIAKDLLERSKLNFAELKDKMSEFDIYKFVNSFNKTDGIVKTEMINNKYDFIIDAPGFDKNDLTIKNKDKALTITGNKDGREFNKMLFINDDKLLNAKLEYGLLTINMQFVDSDATSEVIIN